MFQQFIFAVFERICDIIKFAVGFQFYTYFSVTPNIRPSIGGESSIAFVPRNAG